MKLKSEETFSMDQAAPAHQALHLSVTTRQGSGQFGTWSRERERERERMMHAKNYENISRFVMLKV